MSNYPPGVTGFEDHFGPSAEVEEPVDKQCEDCEWDGSVVALRQYWNSDITETWSCPECGVEHEDVLELPEPDFDEIFYLDEE